jgi:hypothetical protein
VTIEDRNEPRKISAGGLPEIAPNSMRRDRSNTVEKPMGRNKYDPTREAQLRLKEQQYRQRQRWRSPIPDQTKLLNNLNEEQNLKLNGLVNNESRLRQEIDKRVLAMRQKRS